MVSFDHILAILLPFYGHNYPLLILCCKLATRGCCKKVTALVPQQAFDQVENLLKDLERIGEVSKGIISIHKMTVLFPPIQLPSDFPGELKLLEVFLRDEMRAAVEEFLAHDLTSNPTCVISDHQLGWGQDIANKFGVPRICFCIVGGLSEFALTAHIPNLIAEGSYNPFAEGSCNPFKADDDGIGSVNVPGYAPFLLSDIPKLLNRHPDVVYWNYNLEQFGRAKEADLILINSFYELEKDAYEHLVKATGMPIKFVGPLLPTKFLDFSSDEEGCLNWLDKQAAKSVIYASLGTLVSMPSAQLAEIFLGIEASGEKFLISYRPGTGYDVDPILTSFLKRYSTEGNLQGKVVSWTPQVKVLNHPSVAAVFTHYGPSTVYEAMMAGVPMIGKPLMGDQLLLRRLAISQHRIALDIEGDATDRTMVANAVTQIVRHGEEQRANILKIRDALLAAIGEGGDSSACLDQLALQSMT